MLLVTDEFQFNSYQYSQVGYNSNLLGKCKFKAMQMSSSLEVDKMHRAFFTCAATWPLCAFYDRAVGSFQRPTSSRTRALRSPRSRRDASEK